MATPDRDSAHEVYTPMHQTRPVTSGAMPEAAPSAALDGVDCKGSNLLAFTRKHATATTSQYKIHFYDANGWFVAEDSSALSATNYTPTNAVFFQQYNIGGIWRYKITMESADGDVTVVENISV